MPDRKQDEKMVNITESKADEFLAGCKAAGLVAKRAYTGDDRLYVSVRIVDRLGNSACYFSHMAEGELPAPADLAKSLKAELSARSSRTRADLKSERGPS